MILGHERDTFSSLNYWEKSSEIFEPDQIQSYIHYLISYHSPKDVYDYFIMQVNMVNWNLVKMWMLLKFRLLLLEFWLIQLSCSGYSMLEEEEAIWTTNRTAWKFPTSHSWSGEVLYILLFVSNCHNQYIYIFC